MKAIRYVFFSLCTVLVASPMLARQHEGSDLALRRVAGRADSQVTERKDNSEMTSTIGNKGSNSAAVASSLVVRPEHVAFNVNDPQAAVKWYVENLGMKVMRAGGPPTYTTFVADSGHHMMIELFHNADYPVLEFAKINHMSLHLAFMVGDMATIKAKLLAAGATMVEDVTKTPSGDLVLMLRDPWGLPIQFAQRVKPMLEATGVRPEHLALNVEDSRARANWFVTNLGMKVIREGGAPTFGTFVSDSNSQMMLELYQNKEYPVIDFSKISYMSIHFAFMVPDVAAAKDILMAAGSTVAEDITKTPAGDQVLMMRDPSGLPIQFVRRVDPMLK